jgi:thiosulfate dehydrogenase
LQKELISVTRALIAVSLLFIAGILLVVSLSGDGLTKVQALLRFKGDAKEEPKPIAPEKPAKKYWNAPDISAATDEIRYGRELVASTARYLGPKGSVAQITNGMNCQNCHLDAGTRIYGNNYSAVASTYPKFRARSGSIETIEKRINDCMQRSLNGKALAEDSKEMRAMVAYLSWVGSEVPKGETPEGAGLVELALLGRPADPKSGKVLYEAKCVTCHGQDGMGIAGVEGMGYQYPPLWGANSYNSGAGLYRLSRFAGYIKANMPLGATHQKPQLSDEESWDIAAFVNSQPRPAKDLTGDWPDIGKKPFDHPFGPFADQYAEAQHKYGPFGPIKKAAEERKKREKKKPS